MNIDVNTATVIFLFAIAAISGFGFGRIKKRH